MLIWLRFVRQVKRESSAWRGKTLALVLSAGLSVLLALGSPAASVLKTLGPHDELSVDYDFGQASANLRIANKYILMRVDKFDLEILSEAPKWNVRASSKSKKLYTETTMETWIRRGGFTGLWAGQIRYWPLVRTGTKNFMNCQVAVYTMPFKDKKGQAVPLSKGSVGELYSFLGTPAPVGRLLAPMGQFPSVAGVPLKYQLWDQEKVPNSYSSVLVFSGGDNIDRGLHMKNVRLTKPSALPSITGFKRCEDMNKLWVNSADTEGINDLIR